MSINLVSTTDSPEAVQAALGHPKGEKVDESKSAPDAISSEQNPADESETSEPEAKENEEESEDREEPESEKTAENEKEKTKKRSGEQKRIDKLTAQKYAYLREAEAAKEKTLALEERLRQLESGSSNSKVDTKPETPVGKPNIENFASYEEYDEAKHVWRKQQDQAEAERNRISASQANLLKSHADRVKAFADKTDDFNEMLADLKDVSSPVMEQVIIESENGPALLYELAKNPEEALRISKLTPLAIARELGKLESKITPAASDEKKPETKKKTEAPAPVSPVGSKGGSSTKSPDEMDYREFKKWREGQLRRR